MNNDAELLSSFARDHSETAFAALVTRYADLVYSVAVRSAHGNHALAAEVTQQVFVDLARKANRLRHRDSLVGWLFVSARYGAAKAIRSEVRRKLREEKAMAEHALTLESNQETRDEEWRVVDRALLELGELDREALLLRFFRDLTYPEIANRLRLSDDGARSRVERALETLRKRLASGGITSSVAALTTFLAEPPASASPPGLATAIAQRAATTGHPTPNSLHLALAAGVVLVLGVVINRSMTQLKANEAPTPVQSAVATVLPENPPPPTPLETTGNTPAAVAAPALPPAPPVPPKPTGEVSIQGQVRSPSRYAFPESGKMTIVQLIVRAGGFTDDAKGEAVRVTRVLADGHVQVFTIDLEALILDVARQHNPLDHSLALEPNDLVYVPVRVL